MHWIDWLILIVPALVIAFIAIKTNKYTKSVADFLTAGRVAGRYVVAVANGEAALGLISLIALLEMYYNSGFAQKCAVMIFENCSEKIVPERGTGRMK